MEAHAATVSIGTGITGKPRFSRLARLLSLPARSRSRHAQRAIQTHGARPTSVPGSEHAHLVLPPKAY